MPTKKAAPAEEIKETPAADAKVDEKVPNVFDKFIEHQKTAIEEAGKALQAMIPDAVKEHSEKALKEMVEGYRQLVNTAIDEVIKTVEKAKVEEKIVEGMEKAKIGEEPSKVN